MIQATVVWGKGARLRSQPSAFSWSFLPLKTFQLGDVLYGEDIVNDKDSPNDINKSWLSVNGGGYVAVNYPRGDGTPAKRLSILVETEHLDIDMTLSDGAFKVPATGQFIQFLHDYESSLHDFKPRARIQPMPETVPLKVSNNFIPLNKEWQLFWFELLKISSGGTMGQEQLIDAWKDLTLNRRALTDRHSVENGFCDYILGVNLGKPPISIKELQFGGGFGKRIGGGYYIETIKYSEIPPNALDIYTNARHLLLACTEVCGNPQVDKFPNKTWRVNKFPQLMKKFTVLAPFLSYEGKVLVNTKSIKNIKNGLTYSYYNPPTI